MMNTYIRTCLSIIVCFTTNIVSQFMPGQPFPFPFPPSSGPGSPSMPVPMPPLPPADPIMGPPLTAHMPFSIPQPKLPVVVMPYYSKNDKRMPIYKKKKRPSKKYRHVDSSLSESSDSTDTEFEFRAKRHSKKRRRELLTPVISYVTKDGYVVYQKKIKKDRAKDWLELGKKNVMLE